MSCHVFGSIKIYNSNTNLAAQKLAQVFHQHLQFSAAFIMIIKPNSQRITLKQPTKHVAGYYFYTAFLTVDSHCTVSSYTTL